MTRRQFLSLASVSAVAAVSRQAELLIPVHFISDEEVRWGPALVAHFQSVWNQAADDLQRCGIRLQITSGKGAVARPPFREPVIAGLRSGVLNVVVTDRIPMYWDGARAVSGVSTSYRGYALCMIAARHAHRHQLPLVSVNTCLHELLHVLLHDVFESRPDGIIGTLREARIDYYATTLWLFDEGSTIREGAQAYLDRTSRDCAV